MKERGTSTIVVMAAVGIVILVTWAVAGVGRVFAARAQASNAADAAALAAAPLTFFPGDPVAEAIEFARRNGADLVSCLCERVATLDARTVVVEVVIEVDVPILGHVAVAAAAAAEFAPMDLLR